MGKHRVGWLSHTKTSIFCKSLPACTALGTCFCILKLCSCPGYSICTCKRFAFAPWMRILGFCFPWWWKIHGGHIAIEFSYCSF